MNSMNLKIESHQKQAFASFRATVPVALVKERYQHALKTQSNRIFLADLARVVKWADSPERKVGDTCRTGSATYTFTSEEPRNENDYFVPRLRTGKPKPVKKNR